MAGQKAPISCPKCGGDMWNNIEGKKNPKAPDYACKDKQGCGAGVWLKDSEKAALSSVSTNGTRKNGSSPARPPVVLDKMMKACVKSAQSIGQELFKDGEVVGLDDALTLNMATTLFIARTKDQGILEVEKKVLAELAAKAEAERKRIEQEQREAEERARAASAPSWPPVSDMPMIPDDADLPF
jgi:hypothetical protein